MLPNNEAGSEVLAKRQTSRLQQGDSSSPKHTAIHLHAQAQMLKEVSCHQGSPKGMCYRYQDWRCNGYVT